MLELEGAVPFRLFPRHALGVESPASAVLAFAGRIVNLVLQVGGLIKNTVCWKIY